MLTAFGSLLIYALTNTLAHIGVYVPTANRARPRLEPAAAPPCAPGQSVF